LDLTSAALDVESKRSDMATYVERRGLANEVEPVGLLTEGAAGVAVIVLAIIALAGVSPEALTSIAAIVVGVGLMVQAFNSAAEHTNMAMSGAAAAAHRAEFGGDVMVDCMCGLTGIVLGILALVGINAAHLLPPALIVFGGALLVGGAATLRPRTLPAAEAGSETSTVVYQGSSAAGGMEILIGLAAIVLGILSLLMTGMWVLVLVGFIAVGAALLLASATFSGAVMRLFTAA
jgi:hypothetical protein